MWEIKPYESVGPIKFGMSAAQLASTVGREVRVDTNYLGEPDYRYRGFAVRLSVTERAVVEVGVFPEIEVPVVLNGTDIFGSPVAFRELINLDGSPFECVGFIVLLNLGVALTGFHDNDPSQKAVTAFARGRWDNFRGKLKPYVHSSATP